MKQKHRKQEEEEEGKKNTAINENKLGKNLPYRIMILLLNFFTLCSEGISRMEKVVNWMY